MSEPSKIPPSPYLLEAEAAAYLRIGESTLSQMATKQTGPRYRKHGKKRLYKVADLDAWSDARARLSTADVEPEPAHVR